MASTLTAPTPITIPFAASGSKNTIPTTSQIGVIDGAASYPDGFPPLCGTPLESGGKPPSRADMNGILHGITENLRYLLGGCVPRFNATFAAAIGGYPIGAVIQDNSGANCYRNLVDGNSTDFNTTPASIGVSWELVYGPGKTVQSASTTAQGIVELATSAEALASVADRVITPSIFSTLQTAEAQQLPGKFKIQAFTVSHGTLDNNPGYHNFTFPLAFESWCVPVLGAESGVLGVESGTTAPIAGRTEGIRIDSYTLTGGTVFNAWEHLPEGTYKIIAVGV